MYNFVRKLYCLSLFSVFRSHRQVAQFPRCLQQYPWRACLGSVFFGLGSAPRFCVMYHFLVYIGCTWKHFFWLFFIFAWTHPVPCNSSWACYLNTHTDTHTHIYIYISSLLSLMMIVYIYVFSLLLSPFFIHAVVIKWVTPIFFFSSLCFSFSRI